MSVQKSFTLGSPSVEADVPWGVLAGNISGQNFKLMFHVDLIFVNEQLNTQILDGIENHYQSKIHPIYNYILVRPKYPGFSS